MCDITWMAKPCKPCVGVCAAGQAAGGVGAAEARRAQTTEAELAVRIHVARLKANGGVDDASGDSGRVAATQESDPGPGAIWRNRAFGFAGEGADCVDVREAGEVYAELLTQSCRLDTIVDRETGVVHRRWVFGPARAPQPHREGERPED